MTGRGGEGLGAERRRRAEIRAARDTATARMVERLERQQRNTLGLAGTAERLDALRPDRQPGPGSPGARPRGGAPGGAPLAGDPVPARFLLVTDHYPSGTDLYRNAFVHRRVKAYQQRGLPVDVFSAGRNRPMTVDHFDGVDLTRGSHEDVRQLLARARYDHILVHFLTEELWSAIADAADRVPVTVWVHGAEIQPWWRRAFNLVEADAQEGVVRASAARLAFWRALLHRQPAAGLDLVFVSRTFAAEAFEDLGIDPDLVRWTVIHNPIDTDLFRSPPKSPEARLRIWSVRPFASQKYANDLTVAALVELSSHPQFAQMDFLLVGDGPLFDDTVAPLAGMQNVVVKRGFLTQEEISVVHRDRGVFLSPTRWDSQGVARDEAMSSGLVPITNAVAAVPEFVDESCAILCPPEDSSAMVDGILRLHRDPVLFQAMSRAAARRVRRQSRGDHIIGQELALLAGRR